VTTENVSEYMAVYNATKHSFLNEYRRIIIYLENQLILGQLNNPCNIRDYYLHKLNNMIKSYEPHFDSINYAYMPSDNNYMRLAHTIINEVLK